LSIFGKSLPIREIISCAYNILFLLHVRYNSSLSLFLFVIPFTNILINFLQVLVGGSF
jgi:hypothetical protein